MNFQKTFRPLLLQDLRVRLPGVVFRRLRLNRHLPEVEMVNWHSHPYAQVLLYLSGRGTLLLKGGENLISPGSAVYLPGGMRHAFRETGGRPPLCLVLDFDFTASGSRQVVRRIPQSATGQVRRLLSELSLLGEPGSDNSRIVTSSIVLRLLDLLLLNLGMLGERKFKHAAAGVLVSLEKLIRSDLSTPAGVRELAEQMQVSPDHLNRLVRTACGQSVREFRDKIRLAVVCKRLGAGVPVKDVAAQIGMFDQNYFSRWFKKLTGLQPSTYKRSRHFKLPKSQEH